MTTAAEVQAAQDQALAALTEQEQELLMLHKHGEPLVRMLAAFAMGAMAAGSHLVVLEDDEVEALNAYRKSKPK